MPKRKQAISSVTQLSWLDELLSEREGELIQLPIRPEDIGGALLSVLSKGLYTNPMDCIREYVQNAVDARAANVTIKITGNSVMLFDDGNGMTLDELVQARQFGLSEKSVSQHVGFRGIGIYSGFDLCKRLRITSTTSGDSLLHVMVFDFAAMKAELEADKARGPGEPKTSLIQLLSDHTFVKRERSSVSEDRHFTQVELQEISDTHIRQLSNRTELRRYLLQNLPIDFSDDFEYKREINERLYANVPGYNAIKITLQSDGLPDEVVAKDNIVGLQRPTFGFIPTSSGQQVAYYWACLNGERSRVQPAKRNGGSQEQPSYEGFVYKIKGFTIGDRQKMRPMFERKPQLYPWYTGEVYVLDPNVVPNAERDDFETNHAKRALELAVREKLEDLETEAETYQATGVANERIQQYEVEVARIELQVSMATQEDDFKTYSRLDEIMRDLRRQRIKAGPEIRVVGDDLKRRIERLQRQLRKEVDNPTPESTRRKRAARGQRPTGQVPNPMPLIEPLPPAPIKTLNDILRDAGWDLDGDCATLVAIIEESLADVLVPGSPQHRSLMNDIEARLSSTAMGE